MKTLLKGKLLVVEAENVTESIELLKFVGGIETSDTQTKKTYTKHKKHNFKKECDICGKSFKGQAGLSQHMRHIHPGMRRVPITVI